VKRSLWIIFGVLVVLATVALFQWAQEGESVAAIEPAAQPPAALPDVRVRHEFVTVSVPSRPQNPSPVRTVRSSGGKSGAARPIASPTAAPAVRRASRDASFLERAGRAVIGDGRYRPEPFPRIKK
jgi:hypothetical protein